MNITVTDSTFCIVSGAIVLSVPSWRTVDREGEQVLSLLCIVIESASWEKPGVHHSSAQLLCLFGIGHPFEVSRTRVGGGALRGEGCVRTSRNTEVTVRGGET